MTNNIMHNTIVPESMANQRLDRAASQLFPEYSRAQLQRWIVEQSLTLNGEHATNKTKVKAQDSIIINAMLPASTPLAMREDLALNISYQDQWVIVVNKPAAMVVHPAAGHLQHTLVNGLLHFDNNLQHLPRAGIIHRLDKDTSGLLIVARTLEAYHYLTNLLRERNITRQYTALCHGNIIAGSSISTNIGRHPKNRLKMSVLEHGGRPAVTHFKVKQRFAKYTLLDVTLETGRTHQIRVHLEHLQHPIVGDPLYSRYKNFEHNLCLQRQALHATRIEFFHPLLNKNLSVTASLPADFSAALTMLER